MWQNIKIAIISLLFLLTLFFISFHTTTVETFSNQVEVYTKNGPNYVKVAEITRGNVFLVKQDNLFSEFYQVKGTNYFIPKSKTITTEAKLPNSYENYLLFDETAIIPKGVELYHDDETLFMTTNRELILPIQGKFNDYYAVQFLNQPIFVERDLVTVESTAQNTIGKAKQIPVLKYEEIDYKNFNEQLEYLKNNNYYTLTEKDLYLWQEGSINLPKNSVMITVDNGYTNFYDVMLPLLNEYDYNATVYIAGYNINQSNYLTENEIEEIQENYDNIQFAGFSNRLNDGICPGYENDGYLQCSSIAVINYDLREARKIIGENAISFAYPFGGDAGNAESGVKNNKYLIAFNQIPGYVKRSSDSYHLPRFTITNDTTIQEFEEILNNK